MQLWSTRVMVILLQQATEVCGVEGTGNDPPHVQISGGTVNQKVKLNEYIHLFTKSLYIFFKSHTSP